MKLVRLLMFLTSILFVASFTHAQLPDNPKIPHLDLEMTSEEYAPYLKNWVGKKNDDEPSIAAALKLGQRLSAWVKYENTKRPADRQLRLTSSGTRTGIPIETPSQYNPALIQTRLDGVLAEMPTTMRDILTTTAPYPDSLPTDDASFVALGRKLDRVYQSAARWKTLKPYMSYYIGAKKNDVRGFYYLKKNAWTAARLQGFSALDNDTQKQVKSWLVLICVNSAATESDCASALELAVTQNKIGDYFSQYFSGAEQNWDHFFLIPTSAARNDIIWNSGNPMIATIPFNRPTTTRIQSYLSDNIQDEWKWNGWGLKLNFGNFPDGPRVEFQSGVVPHVNGVGGNQIIMDETQPVEEYESQWTIRHEFGHVLGFLDCYHEFYDTTAGAFINYQLDITDLMCSRAGNMKERLYNELMRVYFKP